MSRLPRYVYVDTYQGYIPPPKKNRRPIDEIAPKKQNKINNLNTEFTEMGVCSAVAGNQLPNQLRKRVLPSLFHLRCPSQSHQRSARGRTRLTTVTSISCRSFLRQLLYLLFWAPYARTTRYEEAYLPEGKKRPRSLRSLGLASLLILVVSFVLFPVHGFVG